jgi:hypothetical protein
MKLFNWFSKDKKSLLDGVKTSDVSRSESSKLGFPPRKNKSLTDYMFNSAKEKFEFGSIGSVTLTRTWEDDFKGSAVNVPLYTSFKDDPIIKLYISDDYVSDYRALTNAVNNNWQPAVYTKFFSESKYPVLRTIFCYRDNPKNPLLFESVLDIAEADFQDFYIALMKTDRLDLVIKNNNQIFGFCCKYPNELKQMFKREVDIMLAKYKQLKDYDGFNEASAKIMKVYSSANDGLNMHDLVDLEFSGKAKNEIITLVVEKR